MDQNKPSMLVPAAIGGAFLGVTSALPLISALNCACCILVIGGGVLASFFYIRNYPNVLPPVSYGDGALLGVLTGLIGAAVWIAVGIPLQLLQARFLGGGMMARGIPEDVLNDPEMPAWVREFLEGLFQGGGLSLIMVLALVISALTTSLVFATIGSIIGVAMFGQRTKLPPPPIGPGGPVRVDTPPSSTAPPVIPGPGEPPPPPPPLNV